MVNPIYIVVRDYGTEGLGPPVFVTEQTLLLNVFLKDRETPYKVFSSNGINPEIRDITDYLTTSSIPCSVSVST